MVREKNSDQTDIGESGSATFDVLFRGDIATGSDIEKVKEQVAKSFKLDQAAINQLFSGEVISLKRNIDRATAERIYQRLSDAGAVANIVPNLSSSSDQPDPDSQSPESNLEGENLDDRNKGDKNIEDKRFTLAPLGSDFLENPDIAEQDSLKVSLDHLCLEPVGSNIVEDSEYPESEPKDVDTSHLSLEE